MVDEDPPDLRERVLGGPRRLGLWTLPLFIGVGLTAALITAGLSTVYYGQKVAALQERLDGALTDLEAAQRQVRQAADEAIDAIREEIADVRESATQDLPVIDAPAAGIVPAHASVSAPAASPTPTQSATTNASPAPSAETEQRRGSAFAVIAEADATWFITSYALVADPASTGGAIANAEVVIDGVPVTAEVHSWDVERDVALVRAPIGSVQVSEWRPREEPLGVGDIVFAIGFTRDDDAVQATGSVAAVDDRAIVAQTDLLPTMRGGPLVDAAGRIVGVLSLTYDPLGATPGPHAVLPINVLCEQLLECAATPTEAPTPVG